MLVDEVLQATGSGALNFSLENARGQERLAYDARTLPVEKQERFLYPCVIRKDGESLIKNRVATKS